MRKRKIRKKRNNTRSKIHDSGAKLLFGSNELCAQFLRNYSGFELFKDVKAEDIEDVSERFVHMFTEERNADVVKLVHMHPEHTYTPNISNNDNNDVFVITLIDHKSGIDYNAAMQLLRYMVYIWERYEKKARAEHKRQLKQMVEAGHNITVSPDMKSFKYPLILPIVFYEGYNKWTSDLHFADRIAHGEVFKKYIPDFEYKLVDLYENEPDKILEHDDELSVMLALMQLMNLDDFDILRNKKELIFKVFSNSSYEVKDVISQIIEYIMRKMEFAEDEILYITNSVGEEKMERLLEHGKEVRNNIRIMREEIAKGREEITKGREEITKGREEITRGREEIAKNSEKIAKYDSIILDFNKAKVKLKEAEEKIQAEIAAKEEAVKAERSAREEAVKADERNKNAVINMLSDGVPHEKIAMYTGMTVEEVKAISGEL